MNQTASSRSFCRRLIPPLLLVFGMLLSGQLCAAPALQAEADPATDTSVDEDSAAVKQARDALARGHNYPWYDKQTDDVRRIQLPADEKPPASSSSSSSVAAAADGLQILAWTIIALVLAALVVVLIVAFLRKENSEALVTSAKVDEISDVDRVEALPFMAQRSATDLLGQARAHYEAGNYREAIIFLFSHELVELDKQNLIHLTKGKTNRQYLREVSSIDELRRILSRTMVAFEDVFFGNKNLSRTDFEACWQELNVFERRVQEAVA